MDVPFPLDFDSLLLRRLVGDNFSRVVVGLYQNDYDFCWKIVCRPH